MCRETVLMDNNLQRPTEHTETKIRLNEVKASPRTGLLQTAAS